MKNLGEPGPSANSEQQNTRNKIEHLPGFDVVLNLNYPSSEDLDTILAILRHRNGDEFKNATTLDLTLKLSQIKSLSEPNGVKRFFVKAKADAKHQVDFLRGRRFEDPLSGRARDDFGNKKKTSWKGGLSRNNEVHLRAHLL